MSFHLPGSSPVFPATAAPNPVKAEPLSPLQTNMTAPTSEAKCKSSTTKKRYSRPRVRCRSPTVLQRIKKTRRLKANDRERNRMHSLNHALEKLRVVLPNKSDETKLTKIETLRVAIEYINCLKDILENTNKGDSTSFDPSQHSASSNRMFCEPADDNMVPGNADNLEALFSGFQWPSSPLNSSWCTSESSEDSYVTTAANSGYMQLPTDTNFAYSQFL